MASGVEFDEERVGSFAAKEAGMRGEQSAMVKWVIAHNFAKTAAGAQGVLLGLVLLNFVVVYIIFIYFT